MRVYISGPIHGYPSQNRAAFEKEAQRWRDLGNEACVPHDVSHGHASSTPCVGKRKTDRPGDLHNYGCYLMADLRELAACDAIVMLTGWEKSLGAKAERALANALHIPVINLQEVER